MRQTALLPELCTAPAVFVVGRSYQIMVPVKSDLLFWIRIGSRDFYDHSNGIIRSATRIHRVTVPMALLDEAGEYTVCYRKITERKPYFTTTQEPVSCTYPFHPIPEDRPLRIYHLSDTHGNYDLSASAGSYWGDRLDLLILNGDIIDHSGDLQNFNLIYELADTLTGGSIPCIYSRGNHDTRGFYAEKIEEYTPNQNGHTYFTFRLGPIWGIILDCGEDKPDDHAEYGNTVCCHQFRLEETEYLEQVIRNADQEYLAEGVKYRFVIVHAPFTYTKYAPFDIEEELFRNWLHLLKENVAPQVFLSGHLHLNAVSPAGGPLDCKGQICPVVISGQPVFDENRNRTDHIGAAMVLDGDRLEVSFTDSKKQVLEQHTVILEP